MLKLTGYKFGKTNTGVTRLFIRAPEQSGKNIARLLVLPVCDVTLAQ